jgi:hypothetical protein
MSASVRIYRILTHKVSRFISHMRAPGVAAMEQLVALPG